MQDSIDDLKSALIGRFGETELELLIEKKKEEYSNLLNTEGALYIIAKENGLVDSRKVMPTSINEVKDGMTNMSLRLAVRRIYAIREFEKNGKGGKVCRILVEDASGEMPLVLWNDDVLKIESGELEKGDVISINGAYSKNGELNLAYAACFEIAKGHRARRIKELRDGEIVDFYGTVKEVSDIREFEKNGKKGRVASLVLSDESGSIRVVLWDENADFVKKIKPNDLVKIEDGFLKNSEVVVTRDTRLMVRQPVIKALKISELMENEQCEIEGRVVSVTARDGLIETVLSSDSQITLLLDGQMINNFLQIRHVAQDLSLDTLVKIKKSSIIGKEVKVKGRLKGGYFIPIDIRFV